MVNCNHPPDSRSTKFLHTFWRVNRNMMRFIHKTAMENELSIPQYSVLMTIAPRKEMTQKQLGEVLQIPKSTLSTAIDGLVQTEWLHRQPVPDNRREMQLILSQKGNNLFENIRQQKGSIHRTIESVMDTLTEKQFEEFQATLLHIAEFLENETITKENN